MGKRTKKQTEIELKGNRIVIRYKSKRWATGYTLHSERKTQIAQQFSNGRLKAPWNREQFEEANLSILKKKQRIDKLITQAYEKNVDEITYVETYLQDKNDRLKQLSITKNTLLVDAYSEYLHEVKAKSKKITTERSIERYFSELSRLKSFRPKATLGEIDIFWIEEFTEFLATPKEETKEVYDKRKGSTFSVTKTVSQSDTTIIRFLKDLKSFFRHIQKYSELSLPIDDIQEYIEVLSSKKPSQDAIIALTQEQWEEYKNYTPNPHNPAEIKTYDAFKFSVLTGLRWSDLTRLEDVHVKDGRIKMHAEKTNAYFEVPLKPEAEEIFNKYGRSFVGAFSQNQQQNKNLKKILTKLPSLQHEIQKTTFKLGKPIRKTIQAYEQVTFHSSRRTFASFCVRHGCTLDQIQLFLGWTDIRTLRRYLSTFSRENTYDDLPNF
ncbi:MAG: tyrosine-type recombinase/integrase [Reichenbachiella sp.]|uniref:tyrosine-type recombinase/integrase n=1 Tax=Reichenbachiella sp. TaxID=2184521 RepID=UPI00296749F9|nr:tyrosine-type recombinase/integrase [Reichenbachiella sp.]MDW3210274.1 tyrosine-type recombinase/integrase [Reichenbachiella sp.]